MNISSKKKIVLMGGRGTGAMTIGRGEGMFTVSVVMYIAI